MGYLANVTVLLVIAMGLTEAAPDFKVSQVISRGARSYKSHYGPDVADSSNSHWGYSGDHGPAHWKDMEGYSQCGESREQSPIDLTNAVTLPIPDLNFTGYSQTPGSITVTNNGHTIGWTFNELDTIPTISEGGLPGSYLLHHVHLHWGSDSSKGSEHTMDGERFPMEMHLVHYNSDYDTIGDAVASGEWNALAVIGFFFHISTEDNPSYPGFELVLKQIHAAGSNVTIPSPIPIDNEFGNFSGNFYRYNGSLTTPSCNQVVVWTVMEETIPMSETQMEHFRELKDTDDHTMVDNFRPTQDLNDRTIYANF